tara:strand:+ start:500 stop:877 length:378 start_codon:yes stop_codon:yes gene_type:complete
MSNELDLFLFLSLFESKFSLRMCIKYSVIYYYKQIFKSYPKYFVEFDSGVQDLSTRPRLRVNSPIFYIVYTPFFAGVARIAGGARLYTAPCHLPAVVPSLPAVPAVLPSERFLYTRYAKNGTQYN